MKAAQFYGANDVRIMDITPPSPADLTEDQVIITVEWCGICGSDLHEYTAGPFTIPTEQNPHPLTNAFLPVTLGHEFCGRILHGSAKYPQLKAGDPVVVDPRLYCRSCVCCLALNTNGCLQLGFLGLSGGGGGLSENVIVDARMCHKLPDTVSLEYAALIEPLSVAHHAVKQSRIDNLDFSKKNVLIVGGGPVGVAVVYALKAQSKIKGLFVSEPAVKRAAQLEGLVDRVIDPVKESVAEVLGKLTNGKGIDVVFDCAGSPEGLQSAVEAMGYGGVYVNVAVWHTPMVIPQSELFRKEISIIGSLAYNDQDFAEVVEAFSQNKYRGVEKMVTSRIKLKDVEEKGLKELVSNKDIHNKILVSPQ